MFLGLQVQIMGSFLNFNAKIYQHDLWNTHCECYNFTTSFPLSAYLKKILVGVAVLCAVVKFQWIKLGNRCVQNFSTLKFMVINYFICSYQETRGFPQPPNWNLTSWPTTSVYISMIPWWQFFFCFFFFG